MCALISKCKTLDEFIRKGGDSKNLGLLLNEGYIEIEGFEANRRGTPQKTIEYRDALYAIIEEMTPMTVRQVFYQATVQGLVAKTESGYNNVQRNLAKMRRGGELPFEWIVNNTRSRDQPYTSNGVRAALEDAANCYRKSLWTDADAHVEIWLEKDALSSVLSTVTRKYDVSLMVARGYSSITFLHNAARDFPDKPVYIYQFGDYDPSGVNAAECIEDDLQGFAEELEVFQSDHDNFHFERVAVTPEQIARWNLPTRLTKRSDSRAMNFDSDESVELDAIDPRELRKLVERAINKHMPKKKYEELMAIQEKERDQLRSLIDVALDEVDED